MNQDEITSLFKERYANSFHMHGATFNGIDGGSQHHYEIRHLSMLQLFADQNCPDVLDVGCGFGGFKDICDARGFKLNYSGIDIADQMIEHARKTHSTSSFIHGDIFKLDSLRNYDYVICNGILTQRFTASIQDMEKYAKRLITRMFEVCNKGIAFNTMTNCVNFTAPNLFYKSPVEMLAFCLSELSHKVRIDHAYPLYEYTVYIYKDADYAYPTKDLV